MTKRIYFPTCVLMIMLFFGMMFSSAHAQRSAKGYKGKRFSVNYDLFTFPNLSNYTYNGTTGLLAWNTRHYLGASYVVGRNKEISLQAGYHRTGIPISLSLALPPGSSYTQNSQIYISGIDFAFTYRVFPFRKKGTLAPIGPYFGIGLTYGFYQGTDSLTSLLRSSSPLPHPGIKFSGIPDISFQNWSFKMDFGSQRIFFDRILFRMNFQLVPSALLGIYGGDASSRDFFEPRRESFDFENYGTEVQAYLKEKYRDRLDFNIFMSLNVGIGYLIF